MGMALRAVTTWTALFIQLAVRVMGAMCNR
jgi:hypothetical protein